VVELEGGGGGGGAEVGAAAPPLPFRREDHQLGVPAVQHTARRTQRQARDATVDQGEEERD